MHMINLNAVPLNLNVGVVSLDVENMLLNKGLYLSFQYPLTIFGDPDDMILVVICSMRTESDFHSQTLSYCSAQRQTKERFHPRAYARGPQLLL
jgi:hypothetical protein